VLDQDRFQRILEEAREQVNDFLDPVDWRSAVISKALNSNSARSALARSMTEPIKRSLSYQALGRTMLLVEELPQGLIGAGQRKTKTGP